ncbi:PiggyBac transposable element-derived protein 4 [Cucumispora dikerogammari]|nr:PiggyBac transposable element-derived protein 4 [Cucumispora dikerogammari]
MAAKPVKIGMKFYILSVSKSGFVINFRLYTGKYSCLKNTICGFLTNYIEKNHTLYMDNYYNSASLAQSLISDKIYCCGTIRMRRGKPKQYTKDKKQMKKNDFKCAQKGGINILLWYDKKVVFFLSTFLNI